MDRLIELAKLCEKASGADREIDCLIWCALNGYEPTWTGENGHVLVAGIEGVIGWIDPGVHQRNFTTNRSTTGLASIPAYTASLDAAMSLASEFGGQLTFFKDGTAKAFLWQPYPLAVEAKAATPALALCAASLRASASSEGNQTA